MCVQRQLSAVREKERVGGCGEPVLCRIVAVALREESRCTRLGHACVEGDRCSRKAEPGLSFFFIPESRES